LPAEAFDQTFDFFAGFPPDRAVLDDAFDGAAGTGLELRLDQRDKRRAWGRE
jgi:hypothetical protein